MSDLVKRLRVKPARQDGEQINHLMRRMGVERTEAATRIEALEAENAKLRDILNAVEMLTATGDGLDPQETIDIHLIAAEGRSDDPCAWRADPAAIARLRSAIRGEPTPDSKGSGTP